MANTILPTRGFAAPWQGPLAPPAEAAAPDAPQPAAPAPAPQGPDAGPDAGELLAQQAAQQVQLSLAKTREEAQQAAGQPGAQGLAQALEEAQKQAQETQEALLAKLTERDDEVRTLAEMMKEAKEQAEKIRKQFELPKNNSRYSLAAVEAYARLSRARSQTDVSAAASYARRQLAQCKTALRQGGGDTQRIQAAVRQLESAITRASRKKRELEDERLMERRRAKAERQRDRQKAARLKYQLRRTKTLRALRESSYVSGAVMDGMQQAQMARQRAEQQLAAERAGIRPASADAVAQHYLAQQAVTTPTPALEAAPAPAVSLEG